MKDYSLNLEASKTFILNYIVKDNQIIVNLANGENYVIPYTIRNEKKILKRMKAQVLQSDEFISKQEERFSKSWKWVLFSLYVLDICFGVLIGNSVAPIISVVCAICGSGFLFNLGYRIYSMIDSKRNIKDVKKNKMLLDNEKRLNKKVKENYNVLANIDEKTRELIHSTPANQPVFTLNSIDKIKYKTLKQILENIDREEEFVFDYSSESDKVLNLKKKIR